MDSLYSVISEVEFDKLIATIAARRYLMEFSPTGASMSGEVGSVAMTRETLDAVLDLIDVNGIKVICSEKGAAEPHIDGVPIQVSAYMPRGKWFPLKPQSPDGDDLYKWMYRPI